MSSLLSAELVATCNALGYYDAAQNKYYADDNTLETVKDLIRYLRRDDESFDIRRQLGEIKVVQTDLIPLLKFYWQQTDLFDVLLRLLVNLTTPALMLWEEEVPTEKTVRNLYLKIEEDLRVYKQAFADEAIWAVLSSRISKILELDSGERGDDNGLIIERILILIRNILYVPADPDGEKRPDNDASVHDQVLWALRQSGMLDIILYMSSSSSEKVYYMHILEILSFMLREQNASELANAALQRSETEKLRDEAELLAMRHRENNIKQQKVRKYAGARHSNFGGTYVVRSMKSIGDNELIYHKPLNRVESLSFDVHKTLAKTPKNRLPVRDQCKERRSAFSIRLFLKEFCVEFLNGAYNTLMFSVKDRLVRARAQKHDESYYLWALRFFMEFNRFHKFEVKLVSETMSVQCFHFVQQQMENHFDMISSDKKKYRLWARRLHLALLAYRELLMTICSMDKSPDGTVRDSAKVIKSNIFYVLEYRELVLTLLVTYDELKMSQLYLRDLIETQHVFLKMLEIFCGGKSGVIMAQAKRKAKNKKTKKKVVPTREPVPEFNLQNMWDETSPQLSAVLEGNLQIPSDVVPFDASSDTPIDEQKSEAMKNVQRKLRNHEYENAIGLLRASREVWPENDIFGSANMSPEEEFQALRDIFFADLGENKNNPPPPEVQEITEDDYEDEEDEYQDNLDINEADFKFDDFSKRLAHPRIVRACSLLLVTFETNTPFTNHCIIKLLHRIAFDLKAPSMIFQVSIFITFKKIYALKMLPQNKEMVKFASFVIRKFLEVAATNPLVFMEALFWKSARDCYEVEEGYGNNQSSACSKAWTEVQEDELRRLFMEHQETNTQQDVIDWIVDTLIDNTRSRRQVLKKLKEMHLITNYKKSGPGAGKLGKVPKEWSEEEQSQLADLFEQFREAMDPLTCIMDRLDVRRPKNRIVEKLLVMGLIQDKKEVRKKRGSKISNTARAQRSDIDSSDSDGETATPSFRSGSKVGATSNPSSGKSQKKKKSSDHVRVSPGELAKMLISLADSGMIEALEWIKESFSDTLEEILNDSGDIDEDVPIVPIMEYAVNAMENSDFKKLLKAFGLQEPSDEQETYWRIPSTMLCKDLKHYSELLSKAMDKTLAIPEESTPPFNSDASSDEEDVFENLRKLTKNPHILESSQNTPSTSRSTTGATNLEEREISHSSISDETEGESTILQIESKNFEDKSDLLMQSVRNEIKENKIKEMIKRVARAKCLDNSPLELEIPISGPSRKSNNNKRRIKVFDSSDDEDLPRLDDDDNEGNRMSWMPRVISDMDDEIDRTQTLRNILDSDESDPEEPREQFKPVRVIASDSEDETVENDVNSLNVEKVASKRPREDSDDSDSQVVNLIKKTRAIISDDDDD